MYKSVSKRKNETGKIIIIIYISYLLLNPYIYISNKYEYEY